MTGIRRKRFVLGLSSLGIVGAVAALAIGGTMALWTSQATTSTTNFASGNVILTGTTTNGTLGGAGTTSLGSCTFGNVEPGGTPYSGAGYGAAVGVPYVCDYNLSYSGSENAWIYLDVNTSSTGATASTPSGSSTQIGGEALLDGTTTGLGVSIFSASTSGSAGQVFSTGPVVPGSAPTSETGTESSGTNSCNPTSNPCLSTYSFANDQAIGNSPVSSGWTDTIQVEGLLPITAGAQYENGSAVVNVSAFAVQSDNNSGNDCYQSSCSNYGPYATNVAVSIPTSGADTATLTYDQPVVFGYTDYNSAPGPVTVSKPGGFLVQDVTEPLSSGGSPVTCTVSSATTSGNTVSLTFGSCTGAVKAGDLFDITVYNGGSDLTGTLTTAQMAANYAKHGSYTPAYALTPQEFWNQTATS